MKLLTDLLTIQTKEANSWTNKLINDIEADKWFFTPDVIDSNIAWQLGHLTLSQYYYTVVLLVGPNKIFAEKINLKKYSGLFSNGIRKIEIAQEISVEKLKENWDLMNDTTLEILNGLNDNELNQEIFKMAKPHPFLKTRQESISWNIKHNMWHCGQIGTLRRLIGKPFEFGL